MIHIVRLKVVAFFCVLSMMAYAKNAIVIGASSGMGREVAKRLSAEGYTVGLTARRLPLLESLQKELPGDSYIACIDVTNDEARDQLSALIEQMGGLDLIVISISAYLDNRSASWIKKQRTIDCCFRGFIAMADVACEFFITQNHGHLVGISSTSGLRGAASCPEYSGAKAGISYYMEGMRNRMVRDNINVQVTDVVPGFVAVEHSPLGEDPDAYWEITTQEAGAVIMEGIRQKKKVVYVPSKVWYLNLALRFMPDFLYHRYLNWM